MVGLHSKVHKPYASHNISIFILTNQSLLALFEIRRLEIRLLLKVVCSATKTPLAIIYAARPMDESILVSFNWVMFSID